MTPLERLNEYLNRLESRFRLAALARGGALVAGAALGATLVLVLFTNWYAFSARSLGAGRIVLFLCVSMALGFGLVLPLLRINRRRVARATEDKIHQFDQRLLTLVEREAAPGQKPFLELLAAQTLDLAQDAEPDRVIGKPLLVGFFSAAVAASGVLLWLILGATGFLGYGSRLLWAGTPRGETKAFYDIVISPGDRNVRRGSSQAVTARMVG
ncbi:MAG: hypothetical protein EHM65_01795 [Acidobacteriales bacterium]|nr:MAG: hypothetical protein EHM65_01795 [Terriglobales bacterium]